jgi:hypothetical protein
VVVVDGRGRLARVWPSHPPDVLDEPTLGRDRRRQEQGVERRAVEPFTNERACPDYQERWLIGAVGGELLCDLLSFTCFHATSQNGHLAPGIGQPARDRLEVVHPGGQQKHVGAAAVGFEHIGNDLLEPLLVGNQGAIDLGHPAGRGRIRVAGVAEPSGMNVQHWVRWR